MLWVFAPAAGFCSMSMRCSERCGPDATGIGFPRRVPPGPHHGWRIPLCENPHAPSERRVEGLAGVLERIVEFLRRYLWTQSDHHLVALALWVVHTHLIDEFDVTPYLEITAPEKRCGKTRVLELLDLLCRDPVFSINMSVSAMFRLAPDFRELRIKTRVEQGLPDGLPREVVDQVVQLTRLCARSAGARSEGPEYGMDSVDGSEEADRVRPAPLAWSDHRG